MSSNPWMKYDKSCSAFTVSKRRERKYPHTSTSVSSNSRNLFLKESRNDEIVESNNAAERFENCGRSKCWGGGNRACAGSERINGRLETGKITRGYLKQQCGAGKEHAYLVPVNQFQESTKAKGISMNGEEEKSRKFATLAICPLWKVCLSQLDWVTTDYTTLSVRAIHKNQRHLLSGWSQMISRNLWRKIRVTLLFSCVSWPDLTIDEICHIMCPLWGEHLIIDVMSLTSPLRFLPEVRVSSLLSCQVAPWMRVTQVLLLVFIDPVVSVSFFLCSPTLATWLRTPRSFLLLRSISARKVLPPSSRTRGIQRVSTAPSPGKNPKPLPLPPSKVLPSSPFSWFAFPHPHSIAFLPPLFPQDSRLPLPPHPCGTALRLFALKMKKGWGQISRTTIMKVAAERGEGNRAFRFLRFTIAVRAAMRRDCAIVPHLKRWIWLAAHRLTM